MFDVLLALLLMLVTIILFIWLMKSGGIKTNVAIKVFSLGALAWLVALILSFLVYISIDNPFWRRFFKDIIDNGAYQAYSRYNIFSIIMGPILAGLFEGVFKYVFIKIPREVRTERKYLPGIFGLGWAFFSSLGDPFFSILLYIISHKLIEYVFTISALDAIIIFVNKVSVSLIQIALSYIAFYGIFEESKKRYSVYIAILLHMAFNGFRYLWSIFLIDHYELIDILSWDAGYFAGAMMLILWTFKVWIPRSERLIETRKAILEQEGILGEGVVRPIATNENISNDEN